MLIAQVNEQKTQNLIRHNNKKTTICPIKICSLWVQKTSQTVSVATFSFYKDHFYNDHFYKDHFYKDHFYKDHFHNGSILQWIKWD